MTAKHKPRARDAAREARAAAAVEEPRFWFGFELPSTKLACARFVIFSMLAVDSMFQIAHAARYGAGGFNVPHLPLLDAWGQVRITYLLGELISAFLLALAAAGVATRIAVPAVALAYVRLYFGSQLDSYQHHYLVAIVLVIAVFVPWERREERVRSWAVRLILVQLAIVYFWAAISKLDHAWLDGRTLAAQLTGPLRSMIDHTIGVAVAAKLVLVTELVLAATIWNPRTWRIAAPLGIAFHLGIIASGLEIGLFAWLMLAFYVLVLPDRWFRWTLPALPARRWLAPVLVVAGAICAVLCRFPHVIWIALAGLALPITPRTPRAALAYAYAFALMLVVDRTTSITVEYYARWGSAERRFGDLASAETAYRELVAIEPDEERSHFQLGRVLLERGETDAGLAELHTAQHLEPAHVRAYLEEARWLAAHGKQSAAIDTAKEATYADPSNLQARDLVDTLSGKRTAPSHAPIDTDLP